MSLFDYEDYKQFANDWIRTQPSSGHGQLRQLARYLNVNSVVMSQVFRGERDISVEQAVRVAQFMGLTELERDFFLLLVQKARSGSKELSDIISKQIQTARQNAQSLKNRIKHSKFTEKERARFYSHWSYSAIRLGMSIEGLNTASSIATHLGLERSLVARVIQYLLEHRLLIEKNGKFEMGPQVTHVAHDSPFVTRHHANWRIKGLQAMDKMDDAELFYTGPMALSAEAANEIRKELIQLIERSTKTATASKSEILACLNLDWFRF